MEEHKTLQELKNDLFALCELRNDITFKGADIDRKIDTLRDKIKSFINEETGHEQLLLE